MTYEEAQLKIDDATQHDTIAISLRGLNKLAKKLKKKRIENGYACAVIFAHVIYNINVIMELL